MWIYTIYNVDNKTWEGYKDCCVNIFVVLKCVVWEQ